MPDFFRKLLDYGDFNPRNTCGAGWDSGLMWMHVVSDFLIWFSYMAIPCVLIYFVRKRKDIPFHYIFWLFGAFILSCGMGHFVEMFMFSYPMYRLDGLVKLLTATVSLATVAALIPLTPRLLALRSPKELEDEIAERKKVEQKMQDLNATLETKVVERTAAVELRALELAGLNEKLRVALEERHRAEEALSQRALELARSNTDLEEFAYVASHDLKEPLRMMISYVQLMERKLKGHSDPQLEEYFHFVSGGAHRMDALISDLLTYSRAGQSDTPSESVDCNGVLEEVRSNLQSMIQSSRVQLVVHPLPTLLANRNQLIQLFQNLIDNAIKYRNEDAPRIEIGCRAEGLEWIFSVGDNGIGFEMQYATRVFKMFQRMHTNDRIPGTGIGLSVARKIVERNGGRIWAESVPGKGSIFNFTLPRAETGGNSVPA